MDPDALDDHLDQARRPWRDYPTAASATAGRRLGAGRAARDAHERPTSAPNDEAADVGEERDAAARRRSRPSEPMPSMSWSTNQNPRTMTAGTSMSW